MTMVDPMCIQVQQNVRLDCVAQDIGDKALVVAENLDRSNDRDTFDLFGENVDSEIDNNLCRIGDH